MKKSVKQNESRGSSRAAQNRKIRRESLREELKAREYLRQLDVIEKRLDPDSMNTYQPDDLPMIKERVSILFRLLDKCLPNLRPVDTSVDIPLSKTISNQGANIIKAMIKGEIAPNVATSLMQALSAQVKIIEVDEIAARVRALEMAHDCQTKG